MEFVKLCVMPFKPNTCYSITYDDGTGITFQVNNVVPQAFHLTMVVDCDTGKPCKLYELLLRPWKELKSVNCDEQC